MVMSNGSNNSHYDFLSVVELLTPQDKNITLIPLKQVKDSDTVFVWASVFWLIFSVTLGSLVTLLLTAYENTTVTYLLVLFLATFLILGVSFIRHGLRLRKEFEEDTQDSRAYRQDMLMRKLNQLRNEALVYRFHRDLVTKVFQNNHTIAITTFNENLHKLFPYELDDTVHKQIVNKLIEDGMILLEKRNGEDPTVEYNPEFDYKNSSF